MEYLINGGLNVTYGELLKDFEKIVKDEAQYEIDRVLVQRDHNYKNALKQFDSELEEYPVMKERFQRNVEKARSVVDSLYIVHNTSPENLISIFRNGKLMCADELKSIGYPYRKRVSIEYLKKNLNAHIYGVIGPGEKLFGPVEIVFKRDVDRVEGGFFIYKNHFDYTVKTFFKAQMDIKVWRDFLTRKLATEMDDPASYTEGTSAHERMEFYFPTTLDIKYIEKVVCSQRNYYDEIINKLENEFGADNSFKDLIVLEEKIVK